MPTLPPIDPAAIAWAWETFGKEFIATAGGGLFKKILGKGETFAKEKWETFDWNRAAEIYRIKIRNQYNKVTLIGSSETVTLEGVFTDVYVLDKLITERRADLLRLTMDLKVREREATRLDAVTLVKKAEKRCLMVLGKPGAGKTTFLKHLVLEATDGRFNKIPIFVSLKSWADSEYSLNMKGLLPFITAQFDICGFPDAEEFVEFVLQKGAALVLLDGLDEINIKDSDDQDLRAKAIQTIRDFVVKFDKTQFVMTCRVAANEYQFTDFKYAEVADFNDQQIDAFVDKFFKADFRLRDSFKAEFEKPVNRGLRDLATTPILLSLVCLAYQETREFPPGRRVEIYKQAVDALMRKWDVSRGIKRDAVYKGLSQGQKENLIAHVAAQTFGDGDIFIKRESLVELVESYLRKLARNLPEPGDGDVVLRAVEAQHGIWVERARDIYSFSHLSLQEYFVSFYIKNSGSTNILKSLLQPENFADDYWHGVILNTAVILGDSQEFFEIYDHTLQKMMTQTKPLHNFFSWAKRKSVSYPLNLKQLHIIVILNEFIANSYIRGHTLALDRPLAIALDLDRALDRDSTFALARARARDLDFSLGGTRDFARDLDLALALSLAYRLAHNNEGEFDIDLERDLSLALSRTLSLSFSFALSLSLDLYASITANACDGIRNLIERVQSVRSFGRIWRKMKELARETGYMDLVIEMDNMSIPSASASEEEWLNFATRTRALINQHLDVGHKWNFTKEDYETLANIFSAAKLMLECLDVATVSPEVRQRVRDTILTIDE